MEWLALSLFVCTVLFLVDKNQAWPQFWRGSKWLGIVLMAVLLLVGGYFSWKQYAVAHETFGDIQPVSH
jgi:hypothetical protein